MGEVEFEVIYFCQRRESPCTCCGGCGKKFKKFSQQEIDRMQTQLEDLVAEFGDDNWEHLADLIIEESEVNKI